MNPLFQQAIGAMTPASRLRLQTFGRACLLVTLTAANVGQIAQHRYGGAFLCGGMISWVWFRNARGAALDNVPYLRECYAAGAGVGTIVGMAITRLLYG